jgi:iron uptake system component EfeO
MSRARRALLGAAAVAALTVLIAGCSASGKSSTKSPATSARPITVDAGDTSCVLAAKSLAAGRHTLQVTNKGSQVTEVYVYAAGNRTVGEVENVGPLTKRTLVVDLPAGDYQVVCKPGMVGSGISTALKITATAAQ